MRHLNLSHDALLMWAHVDSHVRPKNGQKCLVFHVWLVSILHMLHMLSSRFPL